MDDWDDERWRAVVRASFETVDASGTAVDALLAGAVYRQADITQPAALEALLAEAEGRPAFYFAVPPAIAAKACAALESVTLPEGLNASQLLARAIERQVAFVPGADFHANGGGQNTLRLNFSHPTPEQIQVGVRRLAEAIAATA